MTERVSGKVESEIKLRMEDAAGARAAIVAIGARLEVARHFEDNLIFDRSEPSLRSQGQLLRLRSTPLGGRLTFKGARSIEAGIKHREELEVGVSDAAVLHAILEALGLRIVFRYQKYRETYAWNDAEIVIDETPIGVFLEIEGKSASIHAAAAALGKTPADYISESYAALFFASGGRGDMVFP
jgi:adenylate cyclase class 2